MRTQTTLYSLWLPITQFKKILKILDKKNIIYEYKSNNDWDWLNFKYSGSLIVMDSLGYIYIETNEENREVVFKFIETILNSETKSIIKETFLNPRIQNFETPLSILDFMKSVYIEILSCLNLKIEYISAHLLVYDKKICTNEKIKFSVKKDNKIVEESSFYHILNRNFCQLLNKSVYFTHGLEFEEGEIYGCLSLLKEDKLKPLLKSIEESNISFKINNKLNNNILLGVLRKAIQDTIEEKTVLHFLNITKTKYLNNILDKISSTNSSLNKLNSYLLATPSQQNLLSNTIESHDFDEEDIEVFVQNLLSTIPKFHNIESKIKETYYIKIGNTTTSNRVEKSETISKTFFYSKWKASIQYFMETVENIKESLTIYHQNKNLKELEDISYNANYQADIEDIRDLKNDESKLFNDSAKKYINLILFIFAIITLVGEAPLYRIGGGFNIIIQNFEQHIINMCIYFLILSPVVLFIVFRNKLFIKKNDKDKSVFIFENSDYDKHEHRSNKSLYTTKNGKESKLILSYNDVLSAYTLMKKLKIIKVAKQINNIKRTFYIFPEILRKTPINKNYSYRENYRISRNDKVTTKIMFRYKITNISLKEFLELLNSDSFIEYYLEYISKEDIENDFSKERLLNSLKVENWNSEDVKLNLYIVYSFILKLNQISKNNCDYSVVKDQFRVHFHINKLYFSTQDDLEKQQEALAQLIYIYFLARLKKFA